MRTIIDLWDIIKDDKCPEYDANWVRAKIKEIIDHGGYLDKGMD